MDEAHALAESGTPENPYRTQRTHLGVALRGAARGLLLLTATPHTLGRWTTVDMAAREVAENGAPVTAEAVAARIEATPEWTTKLQREEFALDKIRDSLAGLRRFGFLGDEGTRE